MRFWRKSSFGLKLALGTTVVLALAVVWVLASPLWQDANTNDAAIKTSASPKPDDAKLASKLLDLGTQAKISPNYRIAVTGISVYDVPQGRLVVPTIEATYIGTEDGEPWADLNVEFAGSGSKSEPKTYGESDCPAGIGHSEASEQPTLGTGDDETYEVCIQVPVKTVKAGQIQVGEAFSTGDPIAWSTKEAVTKTLPSPEPELSVAPAAPANRRQPPPARQPADFSDSKACRKFDEDKYHDYKEWGDKLKDQYEERKDTLSSDDIDDYKDWKHDYDRMLEYYKKLDEACS